MNRRGFFASLAAVAALPFVKVAKPALPATLYGLPIVWTHEIPILSKADIRLLDVMTVPRPLVLRAYSIPLLCKVPPELLL